jgi:hypothetical protein
LFDSCRNTKFPHLILKFNEPKKVRKNHEDDYHVRYCIITDEEEEKEEKSQTKESFKVKSRGQLPGQ